MQMLNAKSPFILVHSPLISNFDISRMVDAHKARKESDGNYIMTMGVARGGRSVSSLSRYCWCGLWKCYAERANPQTTPRIPNHASHTDIQTFTHHPPCHSPTSIPHQPPLHPIQRSRCPTTSGRGLRDLVRHLLQPSRRVSRCRSRHM